MVVGNFCQQPKKPRPPCTHLSSVNPKNNLFANKQQQQQQQQTNKMGNKQTKKNAPQGPDDSKRFTIISKRTQSYEAAHKRGTINFGAAPVNVEVVSGDTANVPKPKKRYEEERLEQISKTFADKKMVLPLAKIAGMGRFIILIQNTSARDTDHQITAVTVLQGASVLRKTNEALKSYAEWKLEIGGKDNELQNISIEMLTNKIGTSVVVTLVQVCRFILL